MWKEVTKDGPRALPTTSNNSLKIMFDHSILFFEFLNAIFSTTKDPEKDKEHSLTTDQYNRNHKLLSLPDKVFHFIISQSIDTTKPLKDIIKPLLLLRTTCKYFNTEQFLITIGKACHNYPLTEKNKAMKMLLKRMNDNNYTNRRAAALLLTYTGADNDAYKADPLLYRAVNKSDIKLIITLLHHNANPNQITLYKDPTLFSIKTVEIAKLFIEYKVNLKIPGNEILPNPLFACLIYDYPLDLFNFYLNNKVDATAKNYKGSLLHLFARKYLWNNTYENYLNSAILLIKRAPELLNQLNDQELTPLDLANEALENECIKTMYQHHQAFIKLLKEYGAKTAVELKQINTQQ